LNGKVILVGAGPGDPGLLTVRGQEWLAQADVVVTDALVNPRLWRGLRARIIDVGKRGPGAPRGAHQRESQANINRILVRLARQGNTVVRLKGGDPFVFGRGSEELEALRVAKISFEVVPGVSSAHAVPAYAGIPITDRRFASHVTILTGHEKGEQPSKQSIDWDRLSPDGTLVILMGVSRWPDIQKELLGRHWPPSHPVAAIEWGTTVRQRVIHSSLEQAAADFKKQKLQAPAIIVVGRVAKLGRQLEWVRRNRPLLGLKIVVMRPLEQAGELIAALENKGAQVLHAPAIRIRSLAGSASVRRKIKKIQSQPHSYDFLIFLSANAVRHFETVAPLLTRQWRHAAVAVVGDQTARVAREHGWRVTMKPSLYRATSLVRELGGISGKRILIPRAETAPIEILEDLRDRGATVDVLPVYRTAPVPFSASVKHEIQSGADVLMFTSSSMVGSFLRNFSTAEKRRLLRTARIVSMGALTTAALRKHGVRQIHQARNSSVDELVSSAIEVKRKS
jgi:uroporphyrinogen III methyltransferase/synthase